MDLLYHYLHQNNTIITFITVLLKYYKKLLNTYYFKCLCSCFMHQKFTSQFLIIKLTYYLSLPLVITFFIVVALSLTTLEINVVPFFLIRIYMDYNATTPVDPEVVSVVTEALNEAWGNPSSMYLPGVFSACSHTTHLQYSKIGFTCILLSYSRSESQRHH